MSKSRENILAKCDPPGEGGNKAKSKKQGRNKAFLLFCTKKQGRNKEMGGGKYPD